MLIYKKLSISVPKFPLWSSHILLKKSPSNFMSFRKNNPLSPVRTAHTFMSAHFPTV